MSSSMNLSLSLRGSSLVFQLFEEQWCADVYSVFLACFKYLSVKVSVYFWQLFYVVDECVKSVFNRVVLEFCYPHMGFGFL